MATIACWLFFDLLALVYSLDFPWISLGLAGNLNADPTVARTAVKTWLEVGGRALDAAMMYYNDEGVRQGLESGNQNLEIFISTKIPPERMGFQETLEAIKEVQKTMLPSERLGGKGHQEFSFFPFKGKFCLIGNDSKQPKITSKNFV